MHVIVFTQIVKVIHQPVCKSTLQLFKVMKRNILSRWRGCSWCLKQRRNLLWVFGRVCDLHPFTTSLCKFPRIPKIKNEQLALVAKMVYLVNHILRCTHIGDLYILIYIQIYLWSADTYFIMVQCHLGCNISSLYFSQIICNVLSSVQLSRSYQLICHLGQISSIVHFWFVGSILSIKVIPVFSILSEHSDTAQYSNPKKLKYWKHGYIKGIVHVATLNVYSNFLNMHILHFAWFENKYAFTSNV